jgi:putative chitinase
MTAPIVRPTFFAHVRATGLLGVAVSQTEVDGLSGILDAWERLGWPADLRHVAYTMATAWHECRLNLAIREAGRGRGRPYGVPVDGKVYYGRGACQLTWLDNYRKFGRLLDLDLVGDPDLALVPETSAAILVLGARDGLFRAGRTLARSFNERTDDPVGARDIVNGDVGRNGALIAGHHRVFLACLRAATPPIAPPSGSPNSVPIPVGGFGASPRRPPAPAPTPAPTPAALPRASWWGRWIAPLFSGKDA